MGYTVAYFMNFDTFRKQKSREVVTASLGVCNR